jgi:Tol biopolymer transport system component
MYLITRRQIWPAAVVVALGLGDAAPAAAPIKLNGPLVAGGNVSLVYSRAFSPDGSRVVYSADQTTNDVDEIFSVPSAGGAAVKLNGPLVAGGHVSSWEFSPDSSRVLYYADQMTDERYEIFSVPSAGGAATKLNDPLVGGADVTTVALSFSPDSSRVLYAVDPHPGPREIFIVHSAGGVVTKLNGPLVANGNVRSARFSPDSTRVLYVADQDTALRVEIFSVPSAGGVATKLNGPMVAGGEVSTAGYAFSPDSSRVLYVADQTTNGVDEIFSVPSAGGVATKLNGPLVAGGDVTSIGLAFSPDGSRVLYRADQTTDELYEIFSVPSAGGVATKLNGSLVVGGDVENGTFEFSPDSSRVVYLADQTTDNVFEIFSVPSAGGVATKLNGPLVASGDVSTMQFSPDSSRVLYWADQTTDGVNEIFSVPSAGGAAVKLNGPLVAGGDVNFSGLAFSPDSSRVLYLADQTTDGVAEIFIVPSAGGAAVKLNGPLVAGGDVTSSGLAFSPDGSRVMYAADQDTDGVTELYVRVIEAHWNTGSGNWATDASWNNGFAPDEVMQTVIDLPATVSISGAANHQAFSLQIGGGAGASVLELQSAAELTVSNGATVAANGTLQGSGGIAGRVTVLAGGRVAPGTSAGTLNVDELELKSGATLEIEIGGTTPGTQYDQVHVTGELALGGSLDVSLVNFNPSAGQSFNILDWGSLSGTFAALDLPALTGSLAWNTSQLYTAGILSVGIPGDYNNNGAVDAADYVLWRKNGPLANEVDNPGTVNAADYTAWRARFGNPGSGSGVGLSATGSASDAVPEPNSMALLLAFAGLSNTWRRIRQMKIGNQK